MTEPWALTDRDRELCRLECVRQHATSPEQLAGMLAAYQLAKRFAFTRTRASVSVSELLQLEAELAALIEPRHAGYRTGPAVFLGGGTAAPSHEIPRRLHDWADHLLTDELTTPLERYEMYEFGHPHGDGNGRNGLCTWSTDTYWTTGEWPTELPPVIFGANRVPVRGESYYQGVFDA
jgi:hypothetical protein